eukprot:GFYU01004535.1.p1 GENE.GFYU01004535.1~~GFYU01004535.1.p1  ORF type:complete len:307 (-),score=98.27 GFYU01004535.1:910-1830(-)
MTESGLQQEVQLTTFSGPDFHMMSDEESLKRGTTMNLTEKEKKSLLSGSNRSILLAFLFVCAVVALVVSITLSMRTHSSPTVEADHGNFLYGNKLQAVPTDLSECVVEGIKRCSDEKSGSDRDQCVYGASLGCSIQQSETCSADCSAMCKSKYTQESRCEVGCQQCGQVVTGSWSHYNTWGTTAVTMCYERNYKDGASPPFPYTWKSGRCTSDFVVEVERHTYNTTLKAVPSAMPASTSDLVMNEDGDADWVHLEDGATHTKCVEQDWDKDNMVKMGWATGKCDATKFTNTVKVYRFIQSVKIRGH